MDLFENVPPEAMPDMAEALAMLGAFGGGATVSLTNLFAHRPDLVRRFSQLDPVIAAATFGGLLTVPDLQANGVRVEALVHLALGLGQGRQKPSEKLVAEAFRYLGSGLVDHSQKMTVAARAIAEKKAVGHRS